MGTELSTRYGMPYLLNYLLMLRATWLVIPKKNAMLVAFIVTNVIQNSIFALIFPIYEMEKIMTKGSLKTNHLGPITIPIPILLPTQTKIKIKIKIQTQIRLETLHQHQSVSTFIHLTRISS